MKGRQVLERVLRTQAAMAQPDFDLDLELREIVLEAWSETGATGVAVETRADDEPVLRAAAGSATGTPALALALDEAGQVSGRLLVYGAAGSLTDDDRQALGVLAGLIGSALARTELLEGATAEPCIDAETGLPGAGEWFARLGRAIEHAVGTDEPLAVALLDLHANDGGDEDRLGELALRWAACLRGADVIARIGPHEFGVLLPGADERAAARIVRRLVECLEPGRLYASGVAQWDGAEDAASLRQRTTATMRSAEVPGR
jgi:GGDEF domain-containing protein